MKLERTMPVGYHLPPTYYKPVPTAITACMVLLVWIVLPVLSYNPDLLDPLLTDYFEAWADWAKTNVLKMFNFILWVSFFPKNIVIANLECYKNISSFKWRYLYQSTNLGNGLLVCFLPSILSHTNVESVWIGSSNLIDFSLSCLLRLIHEI